MLDQLPSDLQDQLSDRIQKGPSFSSSIGVQQVQYVRTIRELSATQHSLVLFDASEENCEVLHSSQQWIRIAVIDTGIGILKEDLTSLFVPFVFLPICVVDISRFEVEKLRKGEERAWG